MNNTKHECDNCDLVVEVDDDGQIAGWEGGEGEENHDCADFGLHTIHHLTTRLDPNGIVPSGECPECQALMYLKVETAAAAAAEEIWIRIIPDIFGYGIAVWESSEAECRKALEAAFDEWSDENKARVRFGHGKDFETAFEAFGGSVSPVAKGKKYYDNFRD